MVKLSNVRDLDLLRAAQEKRLTNLTALLCFVVGAALWMGPELVRDDLYEDDANQHLFWLYKYADHDLFPNDVMVDFYSSRSNVPIGYDTLYKVIAPHVDPLFASKVIALILLGISAFFIWSLGAAAIPERAGFAGLFALAATLILMSQMELSPSAGLHRAFAMPLTTMCLWALVTKRNYWVGISWIIAALTYPVIVPVLGLIAIACFLRELLQERRMPAGWIFNGLAGLAALALILFGDDIPDHFGPAVTYAQALQMPEFGFEGRQPLFGWDWESRWFRQSRTGLGVPFTVIAFTGLAALALLGFRKGHWVPFPILMSALIGITVWFVARHTLFDLYLPNRHSRWTVSSAAIVVLSAGTVALLCWSETMIGRVRPSLSSVPSKAAAFGAFALVCFALYPGASQRWNAPHDADLAKAYEFISQLPKNTLVAAYPDVADSIPLKAHRSVLASTETSIAFMLGYYEIMKPRIEASLKATYATSWQEFDAVLAPYDVDVFVSHPSVWRAKGYIQPFKGMVDQLMHGNPRGEFVLQKPTPDRVLFQSGDVYVLRVNHGESTSQ